MASESASAPVMHPIVAVLPDDDNTDADQSITMDDSQLPSASSTRHIDPDFMSLPPRAPGSSYFTSERLESILQAEGTTGTLPLSKEGLFILSVATEEFIKRFAQGGKRHATSNRRSVISYNDMSSTVEQCQEFRFLKDIIPSPISLQDAFKYREQKLDTDTLHDESQLTLPRSAMPPSLQQLIQHPGTYHYQIPPSALTAASSFSVIPPPPPLPTVSSKGKGRMTNGRSKPAASSVSTNGHDISHFSSVLDLQHAVPPMHNNGSAWVPPPHPSTSTQIKAPSAIHPGEMHDQNSPNQDNGFRIPSPWEAASLSYNELKTLESLAHDLRRAAEAEAAAAGTTPPVSVEDASEVPIPNQDVPMVIDEDDAQDAFLVSHS